METDLILRYLDRQTTPEEEAALAGELRASRDARRRFARISRIHGNLPGVLRETAREWPTPTLADHSAALFAAALHVRAARDPGDPVLFRRTVEERLALIEHADARYALAAFVDEAIRNTPLKDGWTPLAAGAGFLDRLDALRRSKDAEALEIYYLCIALGYPVPDRNARMDSLLRDLRPTWTLSPRGRPSDRPRVPAWTGAAACVLFVLVLYSFLSALIGASAEAVLNNLK